MNFFSKGFVPELNSRNLGNSHSFLTIIHMTLFDRRFRSYGILTIDVAAEFCTWTEQWHNGTPIPSLGLVKTPELPNTVSEVNSPRFPMVHQTVSDLHGTTVGNSTSC
jgi:hypothetical protein